MPSKGPHTDGTYLSNAPRVKLWGCVHYDGGAPYPSITFHHLRRAASELTSKERDLLSSRDVGFRLDVSSDITATHKTLGAEHGVWNEFTHSIADSKADPETEAALVAMAAQLDRAALQVRLELKPGVAVLVDNWNVAHTRSEYAAGRRRIVGSHLPDSHLVQRLREVEKDEATAGKDDVQRAGVRTAGAHSAAGPIRCYDSDADG